MSREIQALSELVQRESVFVDKLTNEVSRVIVGQRGMIERIIIGILSGGHVLLEGVPGLAKTTAIKAVSDALALSFARLQFTPDLLPADLIGTTIYSMQRGDFTVKKGPIFANIVLADEINRAPAKVQSALLEAMQERRVTIGDTTFKLPEPFLVLATQNPIEQEGTYPLPEAQLDRFMLKVVVSYPTMAEEREILERMTGVEQASINRIITPEDIVNARLVVKQIYMDEKVKDYILNLVHATRDPERFRIKDLKRLIQYGASPRATLSLTLAAKAHAFLRHRGFVTPEDVKNVGLDVMRHRVLLTYEAEAEEITAENIVQRVFDSVEIP
ncbi:MAG: AAA family ATPase [Deltaproteobacteria bacterium]|nr:AAA family ATPase [Deltaproteobacteria bacterium]